MTSSAVYFRQMAVATEGLCFEKRSVFLSLKIIRYLRALIETCWPCDLIFNLEGRMEEAGSCSARLS